MKILAFDTAGNVATVALCEERKLLASYSLNHKKTHSQTIMVIIDELLKQTETDIRDIDAIAVAKGPGSFTGLRIGSATAKGLAYALNKPIVAVPTMEAMAYNMFACDGYVCPMMDARRQQAFTGIYYYEDGRIKTQMAQTAMAVSELIERLNTLDKRIYFLGDGVRAFEDLLKEGLKVDYSFAPAGMIENSAASIASLAFEYIKEEKTEDAMSHKPDYYRLSQAEREKLERELRIDLICEDDIDELCKLEQDNFSEPWTRKSFEDLWKSDNNYYLIGHVDNRVVACAGLWDCAGEGNITNVVVDKAHRKKGYAYAVMCALLDKGKELGINAFTLEVRASNKEAIRLYEKLGFVGEGIRPGFYEKPKEDALIMWKR